MFNENRPEPIGSIDTPNQTRFHPRDAGTVRYEDALLSNRLCRTREEEFKHLWRRHTDRGDRRETSGNRKLLQMMDRKQRFDAIAGQLEMTNYQKHLGRELRNSMQLRNHGRRDEYIVFCLCVFICRFGKYAKRTPEGAIVGENGETRKIYDPNRSDENNDDRFVKLAKDLELEPRKIQKCMGQMAHKLPSSLTWYDSADTRSTDDN